MFHIPYIYIIPQTDLFVGVLTVLVKGPCLIYKIYGLPRSKSCCKYAVIIDGTLKHTSLNCCFLIILLFVFAFSMQYCSPITFLLSAPLVS